MFVESSRVPAILVTLIAAFSSISAPEAEGGLSVELKTKYVYYTPGTYLTNRVLVSISETGSWLLEVDAGPPSLLQNFLRTDGRGHLESFPLRFNWGQTNLHSTIHVLVTVTDHASNTSQRESLYFPVLELQPATLLITDPELEQRLISLTADDNIVTEVLAFARDEYSNTRLISPTRILRAVLWTPFDGRKVAACLKEQNGGCIPATASEIRVFINFETEGDDTTPGQGGARKFLIGVRITRVEGQERAMELLFAEAVGDEFLDESSRISIEESIADGSCPEHEPQIDADLAPWESTGGRISAEAVAHQALPEAWHRFCTRITITNGSLAVVWAHQDQSYAPTARGGKWYTLALLETVSSVLQSFRVPDVDFCAAEELPQTLRGSSFPAMAFTKSAAHMDILIPDAFFKYWHVPSSVVPHPWYVPPQDLSRFPDSLRPWHLRQPRVYWRGTVAEWTMSARGRLCMIAVTRPELFDVQPVRIVGEALRQRWQGVEAFQAALDRGGRGVAVDPAEMFAYKFVINTHGNGNEWSNRFRALLSSGAVVFKQASTLFEFWESQLVPFEHYIPVKADWSDLVAQVEWAVQHDAAAAQIAANAAAFVRTHVSYRRVECYWARLLTRYSRLQAFAPAPPPNSSSVLNLALSHPPTGSEDI